MEAILARHRKEQKDIQSQVTQKKKSASKKTRKGVNDECARLERELKERQEQELAEFNRVTPEEDPVASSKEQNGDVEEDGFLDDSASQLSLEQKTQNMTISQSANPTDQEDNGVRERKPNRQKARLARRAAEQEAIVASAAEEAAAMPDMKQVERERMLAEFTRRGLQEKEVAANGHCMYSAVADQMRQLGLALDVENSEPSSSPTTLQANDYRTVRHAAATYISSHPDDFVPFLEEPLDDYLRKIRDTGEWGGQLELQALAKAYTVNFNVLQGEGRLEKIESINSEPRGEAWLAYYRHGFGLGEHYNSLRKIEATKSNG